MSALTLKNAEMVARLGYVVFAPDIFGKGVVPKEVPEMIAQSVHLQQRPAADAGARPWRDSTCCGNNPLVDTARIAVLGYCFGGTVAVEFAETGAPIVGTVTIHGSFRNFHATGPRRTSMAAC